MSEAEQGEVWWADLPQPVGRRPVLVLTRSDAIPVLANVTVAPLTRSIRCSSGGGVTDPLRDDTSSPNSFQIIAESLFAHLNRWLCSCGNYAAIA